MGYGQIHPEDLSNTNDNNLALMKSVCLDEGVFEGQVWKLNPLVLSMAIEFSFNSQIKDSVIFIFYILVRDQKAVDLFTNVRKLWCWVTHGKYVTDH